MISLTTSSFAHDKGQVTDLTLLKIGDEYYDDNFWACAAAALATTDWATNPARRPHLAAAWLYEVSLAESRSEFLSAPTPAFSVPGAPAWCPPCSMTSPTGDIFIFAWFHYAPSRLPQHDFQRRCWRFSPAGHQQSEGNYSIRFTTDRGQTCIKGEITWDGSFTKEEKKAGIKTFRAGQEWAYPGDRTLPAAIAHSPETVASKKAKIAAKKAKEEEEARLKKEAEEAAAREAAEKVRLAEEAARQRVLQHFRIVEEKEELETLRAIMKADVWAGSVLLELDRKDAVLGESRVFSGLFVIVKNPKKDDPEDPGERVGYLWKGAYHNIVGYMGVKCADMMTAAGWSVDAPEELKFRLMTAMIDVMLGHYINRPYLDAPTPAFSLPGAPKFESVFFLKRKRYDCWWVHRWVQFKWGTADKFERVCYGFLGDTGEMQGAWTRRFISFMTDKEPTKITEGPEWSSYELKVNDKYAPFTGEESWKDWKMEMEPDSK